MGWMRKMLGMSEKAPVEVHAVDDENFRTLVLESPVPVLLDVWSQTCAPCRQLVPVVSRLSQDYAGRLRVAELDVARAPRLAGRLGVRSTPTVIYFAGGREQERIIGFRGSLYHRDYLENELLPSVETDEASAPERGDTGQRSAAAAEA